MNYNITAVVVTYNRLELLKKSIAQLQRQPDLTHILVINNGSTDGTREWLDSQPDITVVHQENVGGSGGFHPGIKRAYDDGADWIWCMDDDVFAREDCLSELLKNLQGADLLMPRRMMEGRIFTHEFRRFNFSNPLTSMKQGKLAKEEVNDTTDIAGADFEGPFFSRRVVEKIGLPNKDLFIFCDDTDYCLRAHLAGFAMRYVPTAILDKHRFFANDTWTERNQKKKWKRYYQVRNTTYLNHHYGQNWAVRHLRPLIGMMGYYVPALFTMPFSRAWQWRDLHMLRQAYADGLHERLGKRE